MFPDPNPDPNPDSSLLHDAISQHDSFSLPDRHIDPTLPPWVTLVSHYPIFGGHFGDMGHSLHWLHALTCSCPFTEILGSP